MSTGTESININLPRPVRGDELRQRVKGKRTTGLYFVACPEFLGTMPDSTDFQLSILEDDKIEKHWWYIGPIAILIDLQPIPLNGVLGTPHTRPDEETNAYTTECVNQHGWGISVTDASKEVTIAAYNAAAAKWNEMIASAGVDDETEEDDEDEEPPRKRKPGREDLDD